MLKSHRLITKHNPRAPPSDNFLLSSFHNIWTTAAKIPKSPISVGSFPLFLPGVLFCHASIYSLSLTQLCLQAKHCPPALSQIISAKKSQAASSSQSAARTQRLLAEMTTEKRPLKRIRVKNIHLKVVHQLVYQFQRHLRTTVYVISFSFVDV